MNIQFEIGQIALISSIIIRPITAIIFLTFIIPLQLKEAAVRNGLRKLRYELLAVGIIIFLVNTLGLSVLVARDIVTPWVLQMLTDLVTIFNTVGFLAIGLICYQIYHHSYTPEQKELHAKIEKMEIAAEKVAKRKRDRGK